jgi:hypothetical protein
VVSVSYAWWFPEKSESELFGWQESNINIPGEIASFELNKEDREWI